MKQLCIYMLCLALISPALTSSSSSSISSGASLSSSSANQQTKPEESKLKADAKDLIKASASSNEYTQLAADYAVEKQQQQADAGNIPEAQSSYSQPLSTAANGYSQPLNYPQPLAYHGPPATAEAQSSYEIAAPGAPGYEQPASAAVADAYTNGGAGDGPTYNDGHSQFSQQYPPSQQYQPSGPTYQPGAAGPAYQPAAVSSYQQNGYSQPLDGNYGQSGYHQTSSASIPSIPGHAFSEITYTQANGEYQQQPGAYQQQQSAQQQPGAYQQNSAYSTNTAESYQTSPDNGYAHQPTVSKQKKTVILAIPVKLVSKNKYSHEQQPQYSHVQPAAAGIAVSHQNQDAHDNSGNAYYSSYSNAHDKPVYNEKNEQPRIPNDYSEPIEKDISKPLNQISHNHLPAGPKQYSHGKPTIGGRPRGPKPYGAEEYEVSSGIEESGPMEIGPHHHDQLSYGPSAAEFEPASLQALSYLPADPFGGYSHNAGPHGPHGPHSPIGFNANPMEILYQPPSGPYGKGPGPAGGSFGFGKPLLNFGGARPAGIGGYSQQSHGGNSGNSASSLASNYGQLINSLLTAYGIGGASKGSSGGKPAIGGSSSVGGNAGKGLSSYFNNYGFDLLKGYSSVSPNYLSSLYSSASSPTKLYLPPGGGVPMSFAAPKPFPMYPQQHSLPHHQSKPKPGGLIAAPSNIVSAFEEMFKSTLNPVSKFRRPLYSDATKAITNFYKKLIN